MLRCDEARGEIDAYLDGELGESAAAGLTQHLESCAACRAELEQRRAVSVALRRLSGTKAPAGLVDRIQAARAAEGRPRQRLAGRLSWVAGSVAAAAAALLLAVHLAPRHEAVSISKPADCAGRKASPVTARGGDRFEKGGPGHGRRQEALSTPDRGKSDGAELPAVAETSSEFGGQPAHEPYHAAPPAPAAPPAVARMDHSAPATVARPAEGKAEGALSIPQKTFSSERELADAAEGLRIEKDEKDAPQGAAWGAVGGGASPSPERGERERLKKIAASGDADSLSAPALAAAPPVQSRNLLPRKRSVAEAETRLRRMVELLGGRVLEVSDDAIIAVAGPSEDVAGASAEVASSEANAPLVAAKSGAPAARSITVSLPADKAEAFSLALAELGAAEGYSLDSRRLTGAGGRGLAATAGAAQAEGAQELPVVAPGAGIAGAARASTAADEKAKGASRTVVVQVTVYGLPAGPAAGQ